MVQSTADATQTRERQAARNADKKQAVDWAMTLPYSPRLNTFPDWTAVSPGEVGSCTGTSPMSLQTSIYQSEA